MKITFNGHSFLTIHTKSDEKEFTLVIDPFISGNPKCKLNSKDVKCDYIILTHGHGDHYGDTEDIAKNNDAMVIGMVEITDYVASKGIKSHGMNLGGSFSFPFGKVKMTPALHSSSLPDGTYAGEPAGLILNLEGMAIYHAGDTALFSDMKLLGETNKIDVAFLPIGDNFTMGIDEAVKAAEFLNAETIIPIHYNTFDLIKADANEFKRKIESTGRKCIVMESGESIEV